MTKQELISLAASGDAYIHVAFTISRYCVTPTDGHDTEHGMILIAVTDDDGTLYDNATYFDDSSDPVDLTDAEAETLMLAIEKSER